MSELVPSAPDVVAALAARRLERVHALRDCRPPERRFLRQLPESRYSTYQAGRTLGISTRTVWEMQRRPRVMRVIALFLEDALDEIGVSHASLVADLVEIKDRCMQARPVLDRKGKPVEGEYQFDSHGAIAAIREIADLLKLTPPKRVELTTQDGKALPATVFNVSFADGGPGDYGIEVSGPPGSDAPVSGTLN